MLISGLTKTTLLDYPEHIASTIFLGGCNFRCPFCHNGKLVLNPNDNALSKDEIFSFLNKRVGLIDGVVISGGEPTIYDELPGFIKEIKAIGYLIKLDTNGSNPDMLKSLIDNGLLDYVAMDIKSSIRGYEKACGIDNLNITPILDSISILKESNISYEYRTTACKELVTIDDFQDIANMIGESSNYYIQSYEEAANVLYKQNIKSSFATLTPYSKDELVNIAKKLRNQNINVHLRGFEEG